MNTVSENRVQNEHSEQSFIDFSRNYVGSMNVGYFFPNGPTVCGPRRSSDPPRFVCVWDISWEVNNSKF